MDGYTIYKYIEFVILASYMLIIFLSVQMYFLWMDVDKNKLKSKIFIKESFLKNNIMIISSVGIFFMMHELIEGIHSLNSYLYFEFFELLGFICITLFVYDWYSILKTCAHKRPVHENLLEICAGHKVKVEYIPSFTGMNRKTKLILVFAFCLVGLILALFVPVSTMIFALIIGLLFVPPILALASTLIGASMISKELSMKQT